ncbi:DUF1707 domain-containing protein [Streptomyces sp. NPDC059009]|uniref:DUF1707 SHOCT-like domain-containing protein n=1 Tax=Streptomyces sp. NPDC059009 TaxID=3346694 RepID=UPI0036C0093F
MPQLPEDPSQLVGDDDRDSAARRLQQAYAEGYLSHEQMDERVGRVLAAATQGEIRSALASLPAEQAGDTATISAPAGRIRRRGAWRVPRTLKVVTGFGRMNLDLSRAVIETPVVDIEVQLGTGRSRITVPRDATVDLEGLSVGWKEPRYKPRRGARPGGPTIRISGVVGFGRLTIRHARR